MKTLIKVILQGICIACIIFVTLGVVFDLITGGSAFFEQWTFTRQAVGTIIVGIGFSLPSIVYASDKLPYALKVIIHMGIGCAIYLIVGLNVGWIPLAFGWKTCLFSIFIELLLAFLLWLGFSFHYKKLAKEMNKKIRQKEAGKNVIE